MDKVISKKIFIKNNILTPKFFTLGKEEFKKNILKKFLIKNKINFPVVIKPINEGSSLGVKISNNIIKLNSSAKVLFKNYNKLIFEQYIGGQEIQSAVINKKSIGAIELIPKRLFYDYKAKYTKSAKTKHIMPARINKRKYLEVLKLALKAHNALGCKGVTRADFKFLDINFIF